MPPQEPSVQTVAAADRSPQELYSLLVGVVQPRPIAFVSTVSAAGVPNLAPFSFFMAGGANPPSVAFSPVLDSQGREKDTLRNIRATGEFVVNVVHRELAERMNATSWNYPPETSEWEASGLTPALSVLVAPPRVAESLVQMECRLHQIVVHGEGPTAARYVIGEVLQIHFAEGVLEDGRVRPSLGLIARLGGPDYLDGSTGERFTLPRPTGPAP